MYRQSTKTRKYSTTPIVRVVLDKDGKEQEEIVLCITGMPKEEGNMFAQELLALMNKTVFSRDYKNLPWIDEIENYISEGKMLQALKIYKVNTHCSLKEARDVVFEIRDKLKAEGKLIIL